MACSRPAPPRGHGMTRRTFLQGGSAAAVTMALAATDPRAGRAAAEANVQWRNKQPSMSYRRLGRTGFMVSEIAFDRGLNYLDMAPLYGRGDCEIAYGRLIAGASKRDRVFLNTKISGFLPLRDRLYREVFKGLPQAKQQAVMKRAAEMRRQRGIEKPGYYLDYFPGQRRQFDATYLSSAMQKDYAHRVDGSKALRKTIVESVEGSLKRVGTDTFDLVMCPHGANAPEEVQIPEIFQTFAELKKQGKVRHLGVSSHNDPAGVLRAATGTGQYDVVMVAYNVVNGGYLEEAIRAAAARDIGVIAMKTAMAVATHHRALQPIPKWRIQKVHAIVPGDMKPPLKAYLWVLQNPNVSMIVSNLWDENFIRENLSVAGKKVALQPA